MGSGGSGDKGIDPGRRGDSIPSTAFAFTENYCTGMLRPQTHAANRLYWNASPTNPCNQKEDSAQRLSTRPGA
ncbi:MAG: hypothetical protein F6J93_12655 [Oscillatoria sp. SIO1A7]|nr:hypothetical protein [Oscillatoria sp. SIO1A7]